MGEIQFASIRKRRDLQSYLLPRGSAYMQAMNECLHNHPEASTREILRGYGVEFSFDVNRFWFCLTGIKKNIYWPVYGYDAANYMEIYNGIYHELMPEVTAQGWKADIFMAWKDDEKQIAVLMSPGPEAVCDARALAERLGNIVQKAYEEIIFKGDQRYCNVTALTGELHDFAGIREGYLQARALNNLSFFRMTPQVVTEEDIARMRGSAGYSEVMERCYLLTQSLDEGDEAAAQSDLEQLFFSDLRNSYDLFLCRDALSYLRSTLQVRCTVYGLTEGLDLKTMCDMENYLKIEECMGAFIPLVRRLCAAVREQGAWPRSVLLGRYYILNHYAEDLALPEIARYAHVNASYLSTIFKSSTGVAVRDYITEVRIEAAKKLLRCGGRVAEVAEAVGIYDPRYFGRTFKKLVGVTPGEYRDQKEGRVI